MGYPISQEQLDGVYTQRNALAAALARLTLQTGGKAGTGKDKDGNTVLYVDTPNGQVSWHVWPDDEWLLEGIPAYDGEWDGEFRGRDPKWAVWPLVPVVMTNQELKQRAFNLHKAGLTYRQIGKIIHRTHSTVALYVQEINGGLIVPQRKNRR